MPTNLDAKTYLASTPESKEAFDAWLAANDLPPKNDIASVLVNDSATEAIVTTYRRDANGRKYLDPVNQGAAQQITQHPLSSPPPPLIPA